MPDPVLIPDPQPEPAEPFLRTYAKDAAALGGNTNTPATPPPPPAQKPAPKVPEPELPPAYIIPKAPTTNETRDSVLSRLRAKVGAPAKPAELAPLPPPASREAVLSRLYKQAETPKAPVAAPSPIHTYKSDFSDRTKQSGASHISILAAQQDAGAHPAPEVLRPVRKNNSLFVAGAVLIVLGIGSVILAYQLVTGKPVIPFEPMVPSLIFADQRMQISGAGKELQEALTTLEDIPLAEGEVIVAYVTYATTTPEGETIEEPATGGALIAAMQLPAPDIVLRNIEPASTVGIVHAEGESRPFFILTVTSFERTFAGMLTWEGALAEDLREFYPPYPTEPLPMATTTATTTERSVFIPRFTDEVIENRNVRVLRDSDGRSVLLYGYRDKATLLITRNEAAFRELLKRLTSSR